MEKSIMFQAVGRAHSLSNHEVLFAIKQNSLDHIESLVLDRSNPESPNYQNWLSYDEIGSITNSNESCEMLIEWLKQQNISISWRSQHCTFVKAKASISQWEELLSIEFYHYKSKFEDTDSMQSQIYTRSKSLPILPSHLKHHVSYIFCTNEIPSIVQKHSKLISNNSTTSPNLNFNANLLSEAPIHTTINYLNSYYEIPSNTGNVTMAQSGTFI